MREIVVERHWEVALTEEDVQRIFNEAVDCLNIHRVDWNGSLLSSDGGELFCHYTAPDAESVRMAMHQAGHQRGLVWAGSVYDAPGLTEDDLARANVLVSRKFDQPVAIETIQALEEAGASCLEIHRVKWIRTYFSADRRRMVCLYQAPDAESVRLAQREAGMPVERVWAFRQFRP
jgi:hypothetical protein